jgi:hypothetical protein
MLRSPASGLKPSTDPSRVPGGDRNHSATQADRRHSLQKQNTLFTGLTAAHLPKSDELT